MKIKSVEMLNFLGIKQAKINLNTKGITLVEGINNDSKTSYSNGAGKSSIFESVIFCLYNKTKRGLAGDDVINRHNIKEGCFVEVIIQINGETYSVLRTRKYKDLGSSLKLQILKNNLWKDISKGSVSATQEEVIDILGISYAVFERIAYIGQGDIKPFASLTDSELKYTFESALGLNFISIVHEKTKVKKRFLEQEKANIEMEVNLTQEKIKTLVQDKDNLKSKLNLEKEYIDKAIIQNKKQVEISTIEVIELQEEKKNYKAVESQDKIQDLDNQIKEKQSKLDNLNKLKGELDDKTNLKRSERVKMNTLSKNIYNDIDNIETALKALDNDFKKKCPVCKRLLDKNMCDEHIGNLKDSYKKCTGKHQEYVLNSKETQLAIDKLMLLDGELQVGIRKLIDEISAYKKEKFRLQQKDNFNIQIIQSNEARVNKINQSLLRLSQTLDGLNQDYNKIVEKYEADKIYIQAQVDMLGEISLKYQKNIDKNKRDQEITEHLNMALGNSGLKSYVFDTITPELNKFVNEALSVLDPAISAEISTLRKLKSGKLKEKFDIKILNFNGGKTYKANSGGEKTKVDLAITLAFNKLARSMGGDVGVLFLDEPFNQLDSVSSESAIDLLTSFDTDNIFIISHNSAINDIISNKILIEKNKGAATVKQV